MPISVTSVVATCSVCGESLNAKGECLACLIRAAIDESVAQSAPAVSLTFGDFEIVRRGEGSLWELGRGAFGVTDLAVGGVFRRSAGLPLVEVVVAARTSRAARELVRRGPCAHAAFGHHRE